MNVNSPKRPRNSALHANHRKRMKEKFLKYGLEPFSEHEIMEILLYYALPQVDTNEIAHELINKGGSFVGAFNLSYEEMKSISGIKDQAATFLKLIPALARYYSEQEAKLAASEGMSYEEIANLCVKSYIGIKTETVIGYYFDSKMHLIRRNVISEGNYSSVNVNIRQIANDVLHTGASAFVLAHNHPTAKIIPSLDDLDSTLRLQRLLLQFDINLVEHFVVSGSSYQGVLKFYEESIKRKENQENHEENTEKSKHSP